MKNSDTNANIRREKEADQILQIYGGCRKGDYANANPKEITSLLERQFAVLTGRAQMLLALSGIVITTTGFSGRAIASTGLLAQWLVVSGIFFVLSGAVAIVWGILRLNWVTQFIDTDVRTTLLEMLAYRDRKTRAYRLGLLLLIIGLTLYVSAIALLVLAPPGVVHVQGWGDALITPLTGKP